MDRVMYSVLSTPALPPSPNGVLALPAPGLSCSLSRHVSRVRWVPPQQQGPPAGGEEQRHDQPLGLPQV
jgi:hypothetical protein